MNGNSAEITCIELCAGYSGISLGLERVIPGLRVVAYSEIEGFACVNLGEKMERGWLDPAPVFTDLKEFPGEEFRDKVHLITGGYPCQPFSAAGKRKGEDDPRHLWPHIARLIKTVRPVWVFLENVEGHVTLGLSTVVSDLGELGYRTTWGLFSASEVGAPHGRKRVFILGELADDMRRSESEQSRGNNSQGDSAPRSRFGAGIGAGGRACRRDIAKGNDIPGGDTSRAEESVDDGGEARDVGDTKHTGSFTGEKPGGVAAAIQYNKDWADISGKSSGTDEPCKLSEADVPDTYGAGCEEQCRPFSIRKELAPAECVCDRWPAGPGEEQYGWEPPRTTKPFVRIANRHGGFIDEAREAEQQEAESSMGGDADGFADWMVQADSRQDELRMLGNGVVPATAARAWTVLYGRMREGR
ncbi:MAG: DNA cytosine methyltransferase [Nitrospinota bacterium]|nr:DNA cytosine methyltransferase [Nitrospinota bacterium]